MRRATGADGMEIAARVRGATLRLRTAPSLFSPGRPDAGTLAMLDRVDLSPGQKLLDLGCGYGLVGLWAATVTAPELVWMVDNDPVAVACAEENAALNGTSGVHVALSDGVAGLTETGFDHIVCHPPYHADFSVAKRFIEKGFNRLSIGGRMWMVTRREDWYRNRLTAIFGGVRVSAQDGYFVFEAQKRQAAYAPPVKSARPKRLPR